MALSTAEVVNSFISANGSSLNLTNVAIDAKNGEVLASTLGALSTIEAFAALAAKSSPLAAASLGMATLWHDLSSAEDESRSPAGLTDRTLYTVLADVAAVTATLPAVLALAGITAAASGPIIAAGIIAGIVASMVAMAQPKSETEDAQALRDMAQELWNQTQALASQNKDMLTDFFGGLGNTLEDGINNFSEGLDMLGAVLLDGIADIEQAVSDFFTAARNWMQPRRDPLVLDLDGDGIETLAASIGVLFDHNGDGIKTGGGWVKGDDAFLVRDLNGNGSIDNGAELLGVDTVLSNGQLASDGFSALRDLDSNADNVFNASDTQFSAVRLWRDLNQDGISQADELSTLAQANIVSIDLNATTTNLILTGNNRQTAQSSFTKTNGSTGAIANLHLTEFNFDRTFITPVPLTPEALALPEITGSGTVRDLREAVSVSPSLVSGATKDSWRVAA